MIYEERRGLYWEASSEVTSSEIALRDHEDWIEQYLPVDPFSVVVDVGAFVGTFALPAAQRSRRVIAYEPHQPSLSLLCRNRDRNCLGNVIALPYAIGLREGEAWLSGDGLGRHVSPRCDGDPVRVMSLNVSLRNELRIDLIKIDVEGAEVDVLLGATDVLLRQRPTLLVEVHSHYPGCEDNGNLVEAALRPYNYRSRRVWENTPAYFYLLCEPTTKPCI